MIQDGGRMVYVDYPGGNPMNEKTVRLHPARWWSGRCGMDVWNSLFPDRRIPVVELVGS